MVSPSTARFQGNSGIVWGCLLLSVLLHSVALVLMVWHWRQAPLPEPKPKQPIEMVFDAPPASSVSARAQNKAKISAPPAPTESKAKPLTKPAKPTPPEPTPPVPPPPPKAQSAPKLTSHQPKSVVQQKAELSEKGEVSEKSKPRKKEAAKLAQTKDHEQREEKKVTKPEPSRTHQEHELPKHQSDSHSLLSTLDNFRTEQKQNHPPHAKANPQQGGSPRGGGRPDGDTRSLTSGEQSAIGTSVQRCYQEDTAARNYANFEAHLVVTVDASGEAHLVTFSPDTAARMASDPAYRVQAERARGAVLSPVCARLPIPSRMLGQRRQFRFVFRP